MITKTTKTMIGSVVPRSTAGSILFIDSNLKLAQDNANLYWDDTNNRLGFGTTTPAADIEISKADPEIRLTDTGDSEYTRVTRSDTSKKAQRFNRIGIPSVSTANWILHYKMNDNSASTTVIDSSVSGLNGTMQGTSPNTEDRTVAGKINTALDFNGTDNQIYRADNATLRPTGAITITAWIWLDTSSDRAVIMNHMKYNGAATGYRFEAVNSGAATGNFNIDNVATYFTKPSTGGWHHMAAVYTPSVSMVVYLDNVVVSNKTSGVPAAITYTNGHNLYIGSAQPDRTQRLNGKIDDVRLYSRALTASEIESIYNSGNGTEGDPVIDEVSVWSSESSETANESGKQVFGDGAGRTILEGKRHSININGTEVVTILNSGFMGIGTNAPQRLLHSSSAEIPIRATRETNVTASVSGSIELEHKTTADMVDGFGVQATFNIQDSAGVSNTIGGIGAVRAGADNTGDLVFRPTAAGVSGEKMRLTSGGFLGVATTSPESPLHVYENTATTGNANGITVEQAGEGDARQEFLLTGTQRWGIGIDNSINDNFTIDLGSGFDSSSYFTISTVGNVGISATSPTHKLDVNGDSIRIRTAKTPASAGATGTQGQIAWDSSYIYVCTATNTWVRAALATW